MNAVLRLSRDILGCGAFCIEHTGRDNRTLVCEQLSACFRRIRPKTCVTRHKWGRTKPWGLSEWRRANEIRRGWLVCSSVLGTWRHQRKKKSFARIDSWAAGQQESSYCRKEFYPGATIDYIWDDGWSSLSAHHCQVPTPNSQNLNLERQIWISGITNHQYIHASRAN